jgi:hypothetical protein
MSFIGTQMENDLFYEPEDAFWEQADKLSFETANLEGEWPKPGNPFIRRMAALTTTERGQHQLALPDFKQLVGAMIETDPGAVYRFIIVPMGRNANTFSVRLIEKVPAALPPLRAENVCSLQIAISWLSKRYSHFEVSCAADANYWVHRQ